MTDITLPLTTYSVRSAKPNNKYGSPAALPLQAGTPACRAFVRVPLDRVPSDGTISRALLRVYIQRTGPNPANVRTNGITSPWTSSIVWSKQPTVGAVIASSSPVSPPAGTLVELDVTAWAILRSRNGLRIDSSGAAPVWINGSSAAINKPVMVVSYSVIPDTPSNLVPDGGAVSVPTPILTYVGEEGMTAQRIEYSNDGLTPTFDSGWLAATSGYYDPAATPGAEPVLAPGGTVYWRATTDGPQGQSAPSEWAVYSYAPPLAGNITNPPATTDDGSPTLQWAAAQTSWRAFYYGGATLLDSSGWQNNADQDWTPGKSIKVPGGQGRFVLDLRDAVQRVGATNAPTYTELVRDFTTTLTGAGTATDTLTMTFEDPVPVLHGHRALGIPDQISLFRDGVQVPLWDPVDGTPFMWAPAANFFTGPDFTLRDYTADLHHEHTWSVRVKVAGVTASGGPTVTTLLSTGGVWLVDPRTGQAAQVYGYGGLPVVDQATTEASIVHTPVHGDLIVEPKRRRLMRTTVGGSITGAVANDDIALLDAWVNGDSGVKYRLVFGIVNWSVIIGDYDPSNVFYPDAACGPDRVTVALNWWQRLRDY